MRISDWSSDVCSSDLMGDMSKEPSMEDILSSIKRIIAEEGEEAVQTLPRRVRGEAAPKVRAVPVAEAMSEPASDEVLELTDEVAVEEPMPAKDGRTSTGR